MDSMDKKTCKTPLFRCTVEFQPGEMSIPSFVRHGLFAARHGEAEQRLGRIPGVFQGILGAGKLVIEFVIIKNTRNLSSVLKLQLGRFEHF